MADCILLQAGGGGLDPDELTATAGDVLKGMLAGVKGYDDPVMGTLELTGTAADSQVLNGQTYYNTDAKTKRTGGMPNRGAWTSRIGVNGKAVIPAGYHNGAGYVDQSITNRGAWATSIGVNEIAYIPEGYHNGSGYVNQSIPTSGGWTVTPQTYAQSCGIAGKYMTSDITVAGVALPPANAIKRGYRYWIGGSYVDGTWEGYIESPLYLYNAGTWSNINPTGVSGTTESGGEIQVSPRVTGRLNQSMDLTSYNYIKVSATINSPSNISLKGRFCLGVARSASSSDITKKTEVIVRSNIYSTGILDVSSLSGFYYIFIYSFLQVTDGGLATFNSGKINQILLSKT